MDYFPRIPGFLRMSLRQGSFALTVMLMTLLTGCSSWTSRIAARSISRLGTPVDPPPRMITTPVLDNPEIAVAWSGHATVLIQIRDKIFITDPLFTNTVGMILKRNVQPALDPSSLPKVDFTVVSHTHFDHFSFGSLDMLPKNGTLLIPLGALRYTPDLGFREIREMKPWDALAEDGVQITAVPVQHFSGRYGIDNAWMRDHGYTGYVIEYAGKTIFFGGDTGYHPDLFKEIGRRFKIDVAILPIFPGSLTGPGSRIHVGPGGALMIFRDLGAKWMVPMHHRTISYTSETPPMEAIESLRQQAAELGLSDRIIDLDIGEQRIISFPASLPATE